MSDITRSEAIKTLKEHLSHWERLLQEHICEEQEGINTISALKLAIASLETDEAYQLMEEQPEFCEDCISRNAVMDMIIEYRDSLADTGKKDALERAYGANYVGMKIADMPSVLPKTDKPTIIDWNNCHTSEQLDSISTTKNDLGVDFKLKDYVSREAVRRIIKSPRTQEQMLNALNSLRNATECKAEDCINRDYTAKYVEEFANNEYISQDEAETIYLIADGIRHIPSVLPKAEWIPVNERLPEDSGEYLVSVIDEYNEDQSYYKAVEVAWFAHKKDYDIKESEWRELGIDETVIAWMPLPKPPHFKATKE